jgi:hypothetical protein
LGDGLSKFFDLAGVAEKNPGENGAKIKKNRGFSGDC